MHAGIIGAGRELDALMWLALNSEIGEMCDQGVFGCRYVDGDVRPHAGYPIGHISPPNYSTDIAAAMEMVEKLITVPYSYEFYLCQQTDGWNVSFQHPGNNGGQAHANTAPLAICRAALKAIKAIGASKCV